MMLHALPLPNHHRPHLTFDTLAAGSPARRSCCCCTALRNPCTAGARRWRPSPPRAIARLRRASAAIRRARALPERHRELPHRPPDGRRDGDRRGLRLRRGPLPSRRPRLGRQHRLVARGPFPQRLASLTVLSRPHPNAFNRALQMPDGDQAQRSRHHKAFLEPDAADVVLADNSKWLRERLAANGVPAAAIEAHLGVLGNKDAMEAALAWYRARGAIRGPLGMIEVPTLYIWGDADDTVGRVAAEGTKDFVSAPYRFEVLPGAGHFAADQAPSESASCCCSRSGLIPSESVRVRQNSVTGNRTFNNHAASARLRDTDIDDEPRAVVAPDRHRSKFWSCRSSHSRRHRASGGRWYIVVGYRRRSGCSLASVCDRAVEC